jgi:phospholipase D3/4
MKVVLLVAICILCIATFTMAVDCPNARMEMVESIPQHMNITPIETTTLKRWQQLFADAKESIHIISFYWTLLRGAQYPEAQGEVGPMIWEELVAAARRGVKIFIIQSDPGHISEDADTQILVEGGYAQLRTLNLTKYFGAGVQHSKAFVIDGETIYLGSANMDFRSLVQVKELGMVLYGCVPMAEDLLRIFDVLWDTATLEHIPDHWEHRLYALFSYDNPATVILDEDNGKESSVFLSVAPRAFLAGDRAFDLTTIQRTMDSAEKYVDIAVMDYIPAMCYIPEKTYWDDIDRHIRNASFRGVSVRLLISNWTHSMPLMWPYLHSLAALDNVEVKTYVVPPLPDNIVVPFSRVEHTKYMVTEKAAFVDTSNWTGDYFTNTVGMSLTLSSPSAVSRVTAAFERDWYSQYAFSFTD